MIVNILSSFVTKSIKIYLISRAPVLEREATSPKQPNCCLAVKHIHRFNFMMNMSIGQLDLAKPRNEGYNDVYCFMATGYRCGCKGAAWGFRRRECCMLIARPRQNESTWFVPSLKLAALPQKMVVARPFSFWERQFPGAMLILGHFILDTCRWRWYTSPFLGRVFKEHETKTHQRPWETNSCKRRVFVGAKNAACFPVIFPNERSLPSLWQVGNRQEDATVLGPVGARSTQTMGAAEKTGDEEHG